MPFTHPADRQADGRSRFDHAAEAASNLTSSPGFFAFVAALGLVWAASYALGFSSELRHGLAEAMTLLSLLIVTILKNSERRAERAMHVKLDALLAAELESRGEAPDPRPELTSARGVHDEV
jgi:low affinity Fe/Cu permease